MAEGSQAPDARAVSARVPAGSPRLTLVNGGVCPGQVHEGFLQRLCAAVLDPERAACRALVAEMRGAGVPWEDFADLYIPEAARRLGALWCEDEVSFADVTIGTARLQAMLRDTLPDPDPRPGRAADAPSVVVAVRPDDYHTLGAMVAATRLRRAGVAVRLSLGQPEGDLVRLLSGGGFDALFLSASGSGSLDSLRDLVEKVRNSIGPGVPIVLGGTILVTDRDARVMTGVDHAASDPIEALRLCGLRVPREHVATAANWS